MQQIVRDQIAVITGGTSGIGLGMANAFAAAGYHLAVNGFAAPGEAEALARDLEQQHKVGVHYCPADLAIPEECAAFITEAQRHFGRIDVLINNAGIQYVAPVEQFPTDRWDAILAVNLSAAFHTTRTALPGMQQRGYGRIINIASAHGLVASVNKSAYVASKHGIVGLTKVVALENAQRGITCNAICPGFVLTAMVQKQIEAIAAASHVSVEQATREFQQEKRPSGRYTSVEEIAAMALFLCSEGAGNITGACLSVDGGWTAQ